MRSKVIKAVALIVVLALLVVLIRPQQVWSFLAGPPDLGGIDFRTVQRSGKPNAYLLCPASFCTAYQPDREPVEFELDAATLMQRAKKIWGREPRVQLVYESPSEYALRYVQRTAILKFPDTISVRFIRIADNHSTIAIYSRSQIGNSDFGANETRANHWLRLLEQGEP